MPAEATDLSEAPDEKAPKKVVWNFELIDIPRLEEVEPAHRIDRVNQNMPNVARCMVDHQDPIYIHQVRWKFQYLCAMSVPSFHQRSQHIRLNLLSLVA